MTISYELDRNDYVEYNYFYVKEKKKRSRISIIVFFAALCYLVFNQYMDGAETISDYLTGPVIFFAAYILLLLFIWSKWNVRNTMNRMLKSGRNTGLLGPRTMTFSEENLLVVNDYAESKLKWEQFEYLKESKQHLFLFITVNQAYIIPKRIFLLDQELHDVQSFIERKLAQQVR